MIEYATAGTSGPADRLCHRSHAHRRDRRPERIRAAEGIRYDHVLAVMAVCTTSDMALIPAGVAGFGALITTDPQIVTLARFGGAAFLVAYGALAARQAWGRGV